MKHPMKAAGLALAGIVLSWGMQASAGNHSPQGCAFVKQRVPPAVIVDGATLATVVCPAVYLAAATDLSPLHQVYEGGTITYSPAPSAMAIRFLVDGVERITGKKLAVAEEGTPVAGPQIHVGLTRLVKERLGAALQTMDREGYILLSTPDALLVAGGDDYGTVFAVSALLEKYAGARRFFPGELGKVYPQQERLVLAEVNWRDEPAFKSREIPIGNPNDFNAPGKAEYFEWQLWNHVRDGRFHFSHNLSYMLPPEVYAKTHPEWYPVISGKRIVPEPGMLWKPCLSAPGLPEEVARLVIAFFDAHPEEETFSLGQIDGGGWCECAECAKLDGADANTIWDEYSGRYSRRVTIFNNRVAELVAPKYPGKKLGCLAYSWYIVPPKDLKLHPMIMPYICSTRDGYADPVWAKRDRANLEGWGRIASQVGLYDYFYGVGVFVPRIYTETLAKVLRHDFAYGARGWICEANANWGLDAPKLHALAKLLWDPQSDPSALRHDFCDNLFGPAASPMYDLFRLVEKAWADASAKRIIPGRGWWYVFFPGNPAQLLPYTPEVIAAMNAKCAEARLAAASDPVALERVEFFAKCYEMVNLLAPRARLEQSVARQAPLRDVLEAVRPDDPPLKEALVAYAKEHQFGIFETYPRFCWLWEGFVSQNGSDLASQITAGLGRRVAREVIGETAVKKASSPAQFTNTLDNAVAASLKRQLGETDGNPRLAGLQQQVRDWAMKVAPAGRTATPPKIDGHLDETVWQNAAPCRSFGAYVTGKPVETHTEFAFCYDADNLYLGVWCEQDPAELAAVAPAQVRDEWDRNCVEVFLGREGEAATPWQIILSRGGQVADGCNEGDLSYNLPGLRCAGQVTATGWTAELVVPWKDLGMNSKRDRVSLLNVVRNRCRKLPDGTLTDEISTWFRSAGSHMDRQNRGYLVLK